MVYLNKETVSRRVLNTLLQLYDVDYYFGKYGGDQRKYKKSRILSESYT